MSWTPTALTGDVLVHSNTDGSQRVPAVSALTGGGYVVVWDSFDFATNLTTVINAQQFNSDGTPNGSLIVVPVVGHSVVPDVAGTADGGFAVTWWGQGGTTSATAVWVQRYNASGAAVGALIEVSAPPQSNAAYPVVTHLENGGFVVLYNAGTGSGSREIYGRVYDSNGVLTGSFSEAAEGLAAPAVAALADGGFVLVNSYNSYNSYTGRHLQRYDATGTAVGAAVELSTEGHQFSVAALAGGASVATWVQTIYSGESSTQEIAARIVFANGNAGPLLTVKQIASGTGVYLENTSVVALPDGTFIVLWGESDNPETVGNNDNVFAQRFSSSGAPLGSEFQVNVGIADFNFEGGPHQATVLANGDIAVTFVGDVNDPNVYTRVFDVEYQANGENGGSIAEDSGPQTLSGNVLTNDENFSTGSNVGLTVDVAALSDEDPVAAGTQVSGAFGTFTIASDGAWCYAPFDLGNLAAGESITETLTYSVLSALGNNLGSASLTVTVTGTPDVVLGDFSGVDENTPGGTTLNSAPLDFSDSNAGTITVHSMVDNPYFELDTSEVVPFGNWRVKVKAGADIDFEALTDIDAQGRRYITVTVVVSDSNTGAAQYTLPLRIEVNDDPDEGIVGTNGHDVLVGTLGADFIRGLGGNDILDGKGGADTVLGGDGNDQITYYAGAVQLDGGADSDVLFVNLASANAAPPTTFSLTANHFEQAITNFSDLYVGGVVGRSTYKYYDTNWQLTLTLVERYDNTNTQNYSYYQDIYNAAGQKTSTTIYYDSGSLAGGQSQYIYDLDAATPLAYTVTYTDATNVNSAYQAQTLAYDTAGTILMRDVTYDNNTRIKTTFDLVVGNGLLKTTENFNALGEATTTRIDYENGNRGYTTFDIVSDGIQQTWSQYTSVFTAGGLKISQDTLYDTGTRSLYTYTTPGVTTDYVVEQWNALGEKTSSTARHTDGSREVTSYDIQSDGNASWTEQTSFYNTSGVRTTAEIAYDDGSSSHYSYIDDATTSGSDVYGFRNAAEGQVEQWVSKFYLNGIGSTLTTERHRFNDNTQFLYTYDYLDTDPLHAGRVDYLSATGAVLGTAFF